MMKLTLWLATIFFSSLSYSQYALVWSDEFDNNELNLNKWTYDLGLGDWGWGNFFTFNSEDLVRNKVFF